MRMLLLLACVAAGLALGCTRHGGEHGADSVGALEVPLVPASAAGAEAACDKRALDALRVVDTSRLRKRELAAPVHSAEGSSAVAYLDGDRPRLVAVTHMGEGGYAEERYYVRDSLSFVREREETRYDRPITEGEPDIASEADEQPLYVCQGRVVQGPPDADTAYPLETISALLRQLR